MRPPAPSSSSSSSTCPETHRLKASACSAGVEVHMRALVLLAALLCGCGEHGCCGDNDPAPDATSVDALEFDACICRPEWPGCPPGCSPPADAGEDR